MDVRFIGERDIKPEVWDCLLNAAAAIKNTHYRGVLIEFSEVMSPARKAMLGNEHILILNFGGIGAKSAVDANISLNGSKENMLVQELEGMELQGWSPMKTSDGKLTIGWRKAPFLYSCIDIKHMGKSDVIVSLIKLLAKELGAMPSYKRKDDLEANIRDLQSLMLLAAGGGIDEIKDALKANLVRIRDYSKYIAKYQSESRKLREKARLLSGQAAGLKMDARQMLARALKIKGVSAISVEGSRVCILTDRLSAKMRNPHNKKVESFDIGRFMIRWDDGDRMIIENLDKAAGFDYDHPHIEDGSPCWGNMEGISRYAQEMRLDVVIQLLLSYLQILEGGHPYIGPWEWVKSFKTGHLPDEEEDFV